MFVEELVVKSSIHVILAKEEDMKPRGFGSGCLIKYKNRLFFISVRHVTDAQDLSTFLETNQPSVNGETPLSWRTRVACAPHANHDFIVTPNHSTPRSPR